MEVTEEMRRAVYELDCADFGHLIDLRNAIGTVSHDSAGMVVRPAAEFVLPFVTCSRCGRAWIVSPLDGWSYEDAERILYGMLRPDSDLARTITRNRGQREAGAAS